MLPIQESLSYKMNLFEVDLKSAWVFKQLLDQNFVFQHGVSVFVNGSIIVLQPPRDCESQVNVFVYGSSE